MSSFADGSRASRPSSALESLQPLETLGRSAPSVGARPGCIERLGRRFARALLPLFLAVLGACSQGSSDAPPADLPATSAPGTLTLRLGPIDLKAGEETTRCITAHLPTTAAIDIQQISTQQHLSHHVIFYREVPDRADTGIVGCAPLNLIGAGSRAPLFIGENNRAADSQLVLPEGVGYHLAAGQAYTIEGHFLNASTSAQQAYADVVLQLAPAGTELVPADMIFISAVSVLDKSYDGAKGGLPPLRATDADPAFLQVPSSLAEAQVFALTTHQHRFGTRAEIERATDLTGPGQSLYVNTDWEHPALKHFQPPLTFAPGEGLRFTCAFNNTSSSYVKYGDSAVTDEMCIIGAA